MSHCLAPDQTEHNEKKVDWIKYSTLNVESRIDTWIEWNEKNVLFFHNTQVINGSISPETAQMRHFNPATIYLINANQQDIDITCKMVFFSTSLLFRSFWMNEKVVKFSNDYISIEPFLLWFVINSTTFRICNCGDQFFQSACLLLPRTICLHSQGN